MKKSEQIDAHKKGDTLPKYFQSLIPTDAVDGRFFEKISADSSRGGSQTLPQICSFLRSCRDKEGAVILLDEIDKLGEMTASPWYSSVRLEVFQLLDGNGPSPYGHRF